jgi:hypothetical protein
VETLD